MENKIQKVASHFEMGSALFKSAEVYGTGHINETYRVIYTENGQDHPYIFQKINTNIFKKPDQLMDNMARVLEQSAKSLADHPDFRLVTYLPRQHSADLSESSKRVTRSRSTFSAEE